MDNGDSTESVDMFDAILKQEERSLKEGLREGGETGAISGLVEGYGFGWTEGWKTGAEIGFYKGYAKEAQKFLQCQEPSRSSEAVLRKIQKLLEKLAVLDLSNVHKEGLADEIRTVRLKFKEVFGSSIYKGSTDAENSLSY